jgi:hypothetical protein
VWILIIVKHQVDRHLLVVFFLAIFTAFVFSASIAKNELLRGIKR